MEIIYFLLAAFYFFQCLFLMLRFGSDYPKRYLIPLWVAMFAVIYIGDLFDKFGFSVIFLPIVLSPYLAYQLAFFILRKQAGDLILTYKRSTGSVAMTVVYVGFVLFISFMMSIPNRWSYPGGEPIYDERYYREELSVSIVFTLLGLSMLPTAFRKGEFFQNGIATPDLRFFPWNGYKTYEWLEDFKKKTEERFSLFLQGGQNSSHTIHGFSEKTKTILDELLSTKLETISKPQKEK